MKLDRKLNLVIPIDTDTGRIFVHSVPVSKTVFDEHWLVLSKTFALIMSQGLSVIAGPRVAYLALKDVAKQMDVWEKVANTLINEIARQTHVIIAVPDKGYQTLPLETVRVKDMIDDDTFSEILGQLVFFTLISTMQTRNQAVMMMESAGGLWGSEITASDCTAFVNSLPTSIPELPVNTPSVSPIPS